jgi:hypothetical protein
MTTTRSWFYLFGAWLFVALCWTVLGQVPMFPQAVEPTNCVPDTNQIRLLLQFSPVKGASNYLVTEWDGFNNTNLLTVTGSFGYTNWETNAPFSFSLVSVASNGMAGSNMPLSAILVWPFRNHVWVFCACTNLNIGKWVPCPNPWFSFTNNPPPGWPSQCYYAYRNVTNF